MDKVALEETSHYKIVAKIGGIILKGNINISVNKIISVNFVAKNQLMKKTLLELLVLLQQKYSLVYKCTDIDIYTFQKYFKNKEVSYKENDAKKFIIKKFPELIVKDVSNEDLEFISSNWNGCFERSDIIIATTDLQKSSILNVRTFSPSNCLKDPKVFFVVTDGDNPDEYSSFGIYMRKEDFGLIYEGIISGIEQIIEIV
jgi:hypothetical protein